MHRTLVIAAVCLSLFAGSVGECFARARLFRSGPSASSAFSGGGPLARLNRPLIPTLPGTPTVSPLGLIAPRLSNAVSIFQFGGFKTQAGRLAGLGVLSPRISPIAGMMAKPPATAAARRMYLLTIISPRAAVLVGMLKAAQGAGAMLR
jgi:hypothetical protein